MLFRSTVRRDTGSFSILFVNSVSGAAVGCVDAGIAGACGCGTAFGTGTSDDLTAGKLAGAGSCGFKPSIDRLCMSIGGATGFGLPLPNNPTGCMYGL
mgnify:CR=1 FL=1